MQPDPQPRISPRTGHCVVNSGAGHHQTGGAQHAFAMGALDAFVDGFGKAEIVGGEQDPAGHEEPTPPPALVRFAAQAHKGRGRRSPAVNRTRWSTGPDPSPGPLPQGGMMLY